MTDYQSIAAALYDGGWRAEDLDDIAREYNFSQADAAKICEYLANMAGVYENARGSQENANAGMV